MATSKFVSYILDTYQDLYDDDNSDRIILNFPAYRLEQFGLMAEKVRKYFPSFDCRVFQVPSMVEFFSTSNRSNLVRNSISSIAQANFSHKELQGKSSNEMQEMIFQKTGKNFNDYPAVLKRGSYFKRVVVQKTLDKDTLEKIPLTKRPKDGIINRSEVKLMELPIMKTVANKVGTYFFNETPVLYGDL